MISVLVVDDQALVRAGFRMILETEPDIEVCGEAEDGVAALLAARTHQPDVVLMDVRMPTMDGVEATRQLLAPPGVTSRVLMLTTFDLDEYVYDALRAGASGFLLKDVDPSELVHAVRVVARRRTSRAGDHTPAHHPVRAPAGSHDWLTCGASRTHRPRA